MAGSDGGGSVEEDMVGVLRGTVGGGEEGGGGAEIGSPVCRLPAGPPRYSVNDVAPSAGNVNTDSWGELMLVSSVVCCWRICVGSGGLSTGTASSMKAGPGGSLSIVNSDGRASEDCSVLAFFC